MQHELMNSKRALMATQAELGRMNDELQRSTARAEELGVSHDVERQNLRAQLRSAESARTAALRALHETEASAQRDAEAAAHSARTEAEAAAEVTVRSMRMQCDSARTEALASAAEVARWAEHASAQDEHLRRLQARLANEKAARGRLEQTLMGHPPAPVGAGVGAGEGCSATFGSPNSSSVHASVTPPPSSRSPPPPSSPSPPPPDHVTSAQRLRSLRSPVTPAGADDGEWADRLMLAEAEGYMRGQRDAEHELRTLQASLHRAEASLAERERAMHALQARAHVDAERAMRELESRVRREADLSCASAIDAAVAPHVATSAALSAELYAVEESLIGVGWRAAEAVEALDRRLSEGDGAGVKAEGGLAPPRAAVGDAAVGGAAVGDAVQTRRAAAGVAVGIHGVCATRASPDGRGHPADGQSDGQSNAACSAASSTGEVGGSRSPGARRRASPAPAAAAAAPSAAETRGELAGAISQLACVQAELDATRAACEAQLEAAREAQQAAEAAGSQAVETLRVELRDKCAALEVEVRAHARTHEAHTELDEALSASDEKCAQLRTSATAAEAALTSALRDSREALAAVNEALRDAHAQLATSRAERGESEERERRSEAARRVSDAECDRLRGVVDHTMPALEGARDQSRRDAAALAAAQAQLAAVQQMSVALLVGAVQ